MALLVAGLSPAMAQASAPPSPMQEGFLGQLLALPRFPSLPTLRLSLVAEIDLPGPLPGTGPRLVGDRLEIAVAGGVASIPLTLAAEPIIVPGPSRIDDADPEAEESWALDPDGRYRSRVGEKGRLVTQKRCKRCRKGWRKVWKIDLRGRTTTTPLLTDSRVYFGSFDNQVYSLKKRNGHRMWASDMQGRISGPLMVWRGRIQADAEDPASREGDGTRAVQLLVVLPDGGSRMVALDTRDGSIAARYELRDEDGTLKGMPLLTPDGTIVVAREKYNVAEASLMAFRIDTSFGKQTPTQTPDSPADPVERDVRGER